MAYLAAAVVLAGTLGFLNLLLSLAIIRDRRPGADAAHGDARP
jgi:hypothetical protein